MTYAVQLYSKCFHKLWLLGQGSCHSGSKCVVKLFISDTQSITTQLPTTTTTTTTTSTTRH